MIILENNIILDRFILLVSVFVLNKGIDKY